MGTWNRAELPVFDGPPRSTIVVGGLSVMPQGYQVELRFRKDGSFVQHINGRDVELHPWIGVQLEAYALGRDWKRANVEEYEPNDLMHWLEKEEKKAQK